jgi:hypothetical protein
MKRLAVKVERFTGKPDEDFQDKRKPEAVSSGSFFSGSCQPG